jgi:hypothetical protein
MDTALHSARKGARRASLLVVAPLLTALALTGCGSKPGASAGGATEDSSVARSASGGVPQAAHAAELGNTGKLADTGNDAVSDVQRRAVISTGSIQLSTSDVTGTRTRLDAVLASVGGHVADENTVTDDHGTVTHSHLVVRVPSRRFDGAMTALAGIATLRSSSREAEDVTTRVIDLDARIQSERAGVRRLRGLVSHTANLRALLDVERALTQRQGELESMRQQQTYLADQTGQATITVDVSRRSTAPVAHHAKAGGFIGGLHHGWHGLVALVAALLLALGAVLPFAVALALVGVPAWFVYRRVLRTRRLRAPAES